MLDPTKLTSQHLSSEGRRLSWINTKQQEHEASLIKEATNDNAESLFESLTPQLKIFSTIGINNYSTLALVIKNKDLYRNEVELWKLQKNNKMTALICKQGNFFNLGFHMSQSLLQTALQL